jgi:alpha-tubulin suppressor-like RCC1 family protein
VIAIDAGDEHTLALESDGTVWAAGNVTGAVAIRAGLDHSLAVDP